MRPIAGLVIAASLLLGTASTAKAQVAFSLGAPYGFPSIGVANYGYGGYGVANYGYGGYGVANYGYGGYGVPYGGFRPHGYGTSYYSSGYSAYVAPGTNSFNSGYYAPNPYGNGYGYGPGYGSGYGYPAYGARTGYVATSPFMGVPRPFAGLQRVPR